MTFRTGSSGECVDFGGFAVGEHHSAGAVSSAATRTYSLGAIDVVAKPFDPMTLAQAVKAIWEKHVP